MSTRFFTNHGEQTLFKKFQGVFQSNPDIEKFDALVGYLRSSGYFALRPYLEKVPPIRILVGINVDAIMADYHRRGLLFLADPTKALEEFRDWLRKDIQTAEYKSDIETAVIQFVDDVISKKIELRAHPTKRLHAKLYIFRPKGFNEHKPGAVITGSSNLTAAGIGVEDQVSNYEFNVLLHDLDDVQFATDEFEALWKESVETLPKFLKEVRDSTYLAAQVTPYELYCKLLLEYFGQSIEYDPNAITDMPEGYKRLSHQVDAVTIHQVEVWKVESNEKKSKKLPKLDASSAALVKFFRDTVNEETVPDGIPAAVPWEELEKKTNVPKQAKNVRGKLNVPRERFRQRDDGCYLWAGKMNN